MHIKLHFLHGFLGAPSDWDEFQNSFPSFELLAYSIDDFLPKSESICDTFESFATHLNEFVFSSSSSLFHTKEKNILVGYSLGGRLALQSLFQKNQHWDGAILISTRLGLADIHERRNRLEKDSQWAHRFLHEPWQKVMTDWNQQSVFAKKQPSFVREEHLFNKKNIARILCELSLGKQKDFHDFFQNIKIPTLWMWGKDDTLFDKMYGKMIWNSPLIYPVAVPHAGHRVPWEAHDFFVELCNDFLLKRILNES